MGGNYRIKFNPSSMEIEIEGSQVFVETYFDKIQSLILSVAQEVREEPRRKKGRSPKKAVKAGKGMKAKKAGKEKKVRKPAMQNKRAGGRRVRGSSNTDRVLDLIRKNPSGVTTSDLKSNTGLSEQQIWGVIYAAEKRGKVRKVKRGMYAAGASTPESESTD
ncbi:MAG: hypothetical protein CVU61_07340 [Deltaproteobacteria bacterium HGW-Deltaproteobacteria-19]|jgi:uncharacterized membrane protein|nr:MAG: hypothetical protein CVU61_07340 [Deltaproteobacteria bacterium HGW-Deltaproteobacteria-19]